MGGNSLKLVTLHAELCREFELELPIQLLFENSTVWTMARFLAEAEPAPAIPPYLRRRSASLLVSLAGRLDPDAQTVS